MKPVTFSKKSLVLKRIRFSPELVVLNLFKCIKKAFVNAILANVRVKPIICRCVIVASVTTPVHDMIPD